MYQFKAGDRCRVAKDFCPQSSATCLGTVEDGPERDGMHRVVMDGTDWAYYFKRDQLREVTRAKVVYITEEVAQEMAQHLWQAIVALDLEGEHAAASKRQLKGLRDTILSAPLSEMPGRY